MKTPCQSEISFLTGNYFFESEGSLSDDAEPCNQRAQVTSKHPW